MSYADHQPPLMLSICLTTFNRARFIGATLESILAQTTQECEVVVLDGGSTDGTVHVISECMRRFNCLRYVRQEVNNGYDRDCNRVVELARGRYCWLMTDDDLLKPGAVKTVLDSLCHDFSLIVVNAEFRTFDMSKVLQPRWLHFESDRIWGPAEMDRLFLETAPILQFAGALVIQRAIWIEREKERYYGSLFAYLGVIFQQPLPQSALMIAEPLISYRAGNVHTFSPKFFETFLVTLPALVCSLTTLSKSTKSKFAEAGSWKNAQDLLLYRAVGYYSLSEYRRSIRPRLSSIRGALIPILVALLPGVLINILFVLYLSMTRSRYRGLLDREYLLYEMKQSPFYFRRWHFLKK